jgi:hypothetical protein
LSAANALAVKAPTIAALAANVLAHLMAIISESSLERIYFLRPALPPRALRQNQRFVPG